MIALYQIWQILFYVASGFVVVHAVMSLLIAFNIINTHNEAVRQIWDGLSRLLEPIYKPIRRFLPDTGGLDLSPLAVIIGLQILDILVRRILLGF